MDRTRIAILANVPVWTLPDLEHLRHHRHYATWLEPLIPAFESCGDLDLHWITMCREATEPIEHRAFGQTFHILPRRSMALSMLTGYLGEIRRIRILLNKLQPDGVHAWGSEDVYGLAGALCGREERMFTLQGSLTEYLRLLGGSFLFRLQTLYERPTVRRYQTGTAETPAARDLLLKLNPTMSVELVDYGVNPEFFEAKWEPSPDPEVLFLGSVSKRKGIVDLMELAKHPELAHVTFKVAGDGELKTELEASGLANVIWLGKCERSEVISHLSRAWGLVMPTYADTGPTVIKEARVVGLPVVTTTGAGAACYIRDGESGFVSDPGDIDGMAQSIATICSSRKSCIAMGAVDWPEQRELLHPKTTARNFGRLYRLFKPKEVG